MTLHWLLEKQLLFDSITHFDIFTLGLPMTGLATATSYSWEPFKLPQACTD